MKGFIDVHCHLADSRIAANLEQELSEAREAGISRFISSALCKEEFEWHQNQNISQMKWCAGIHPYYEKSSENDFDALIKFCDENKIVAIGEIGLDGRNDNQKWQEQILLKQLDLAQNYGLPVVFHVVRKYYELYKILKTNFPKIRGHLHSFNASREIAEQFSKFDLAFSLGCRPPKKEVLKLIIDRGFFLFETDAPYQKPIDDKNDFNHLKNLMWAVDKVSQITELDKQELEAIQSKSFEQIFGLQLWDII
jgi:TatD DNase family protein